jgi:dihydrofolate reductase
MRKVVASLFISLDGVVESPDQWQFDSFDEALGKELTAQISQQDAFLLGRKSYEEWAPYWPTSQDEPFASFMNNTRKFVLSTTLDKVEWGEFETIELLKGNLVEAVTALKQQPGKNIGVGGSPTLVQSLLEHDLLDELRLQVHPVIAGHGKRLFKDESPLKRLKLTESRTTGTGVTMLAYQLLK